MTYTFILLLFSVVVLIYLEDYLGSYKKAVYGVLCIILILFCGLRPIGVDPDSEAYEEVFLGKGNSANMLIEHSFQLISQFIRNFTDDIHVLFLFYATLGIGLKFYALRKLTPLYFLPMVIYLGNYYVLHDFIQIRAGVSSAMLLIAIKPLTEGNRKKAFLCFLIAAVFHYSSLAFLPILFFRNDISKLWKYILIGIAPVGVVLFLLHLDFFSAIPIPYIKDKIEIYKSLTETGVFEELSLKSPFIWIQYCVILYSLYFFDTILPECPSLPLLLKITAYSMACFFAFSSISVVAARLHELLGIVELVLFPCVFYTLRPGYYGRAAVCVIGVIEFIYTLFLWELLDFKMA